MLKRISLSLEDVTLKKIDDYAKELGIPRNAAISVMCDTIYQQRNTTTQLETLMTAINDLQAAENEKLIEMPKKSK